MQTIVQMWTGDRPGGRGHQDGLDGGRRAGWRAGRTGEPGRLGGPGVGRTGWTDRASGWTGWAWQASGPGGPREPQADWADWAKGRATQPMRAGDRTSRDREPG